MRLKRITSYYHFSKGLFTIDPETTFDEFLDMELYPGFDWGSHVRSYMKMAKNSTFYDVKFVKYEDLHYNLTDTLRDVSKVLRD